MDIRFATGLCGSGTNRSVRVTRLAMLEKTREQQDGATKTAHSDSGMTNGRNAIVRKGSLEFAVMKVSELKFPVKFCFKYVKKTRQKLARQD